MAGFDVRGKGMQNAPRQMTIYCSDEAHSSIQKAVELLGFGNDSLRRIPVNESMQVDLTALKAAIKNDRENGLLPICIVGCAGTTSTAAIDDLNALADICAEERCWFHVDRITSYNVCYTKLLRPLMQIKCQRICSFHS